MYCTLEILVNGFAMQLKYLITSRDIHKRFILTCEWSNKICLKNLYILWPKLSFVNNEHELYYYIYNFENVCKCLKAYL